ncbi:MAG TPA: glycosyltransferase family 39 protein [Chloroflexia bacterium]|nr:glycosyltransferase family 39 protein [Chloroflexia bacterium]
MSAGRHADGRVGQVQRKPANSWWVTAGILAVILLVATWLRVSGHNWDQNQHLNVDDYYVAKVTVRQVNLPEGATFSELLDPQASPLNPHLDRGYVYGALPLYLVKATTAAIAGVKGDSYFTGVDGTLQTGRVLSGLFDALTALLVFAIGLRLWGAWQGLAASAFYAFALLPMQLGHFYICEPFMSTFMAASLLFSILYYQHPRAWLIVLAGICAGLAMACKLSAFPVAVVPVAAVLLRWFAQSKAASSTRKAAWTGAIILLVLTSAGMFAGFFLGDPYAVLDAPYYLARMGEQTTTQNGVNDLWFTRKYVGTLPVLYPWGQLVLLGTGPLVGLAGSLGVGVVAVRMWARRNWAISVQNHGTVGATRRVALSGVADEHDIPAPPGRPGGSPLPGRLPWAEALLLVGAGVYFASIAFWEIKWVRYLIPLSPYLCLFAVAFVEWISEKATSFSKPEVSLGLGARVVTLSILVLSAAFGGFALSTIYRSEHTQIQASRWIFDNAPPGSRIGIEETAIAMPLPLPGRPKPAEAYQVVKMDTMADMSSAEAAAQLRAALGQADYLVLDATQAARTVPLLPWRYPVQIRYYELLFGGKLGFSPALVAKSYPRLFGIEIPDDGGWVDASFMDSSHPPIWVFRKERTLSDEEWAALFAEAVSKPSVATRHAP